MIDKYNKYWKNIPDLYSIAFILDPRAKIKGFTKVLRKLNSLFNVDYTNKLLDIRALLISKYTTSMMQCMALLGLEGLFLHPILVRKEQLELTFTMMMSLTLELAVLPSLLILIGPGMCLPLLCYMQLVLLTLVSLPPTWTEIQ